MENDVGSMVKPVEQAIVEGSIFDPSPWLFAFSQDQNLDWMHLLLLAS
jgi:hypothetical protein